METLLPAVAEEEDEDVVDVAIDEEGEVVVDGEEEPAGTSGVTAACAGIALGSLCADWLRAGTCANAVIKQHKPTDLITISPRLTEHNRAHKNFCVHDLTSPFEFVEPERITETDEGNWAGVVHAKPELHVNLLMPGQFTNTTKVSDVHNAL